MRLNPFCISCQITKQEQSIRRFSDPDKKLAYMREVLLRYARAAEKDCAPSLSAELKDFYSQFWNVPKEDFTEIKTEFNRLMMDLEEDLLRLILSSPDPLEAALVYARIGNYIDFAAMSHVDKATVLSMIKDEKKEGLDPAEYENFRNDLSSASTLVYLTDNCGEIVLDKLAIKILQKLYPSLSVTVIVRGKPIVNDATLYDAEMCGLTELVPVIGNGSGVGGTWIPDLSEEARRILKSADLVIAKGQGNFETLFGCGLNIYYLFLCKCDWFVKMFNSSLLQGMFVNENRVEVHP